MAKLKTIENGFGIFYSKAREGSLFSAQVDSSKALLTYSFGFRRRIVFVVEMCASSKALCM